MVDRLGQSIKCPFLAAVVNESMPYLYIFFAIILSIIIIVSKKGNTKNRHVDKSIGKLSHSTVTLKL